MAALGLGAQVGLSLPFSREQESEADILGINYMHQANYDVKQAIPFWAAMSAGGGSRPPNSSPPTQIRPSASSASAPTSTSKAGGRSKARLASAGRGR